MKVVFFEAYPGFRGAQRSLALLARTLEGRGLEVEVWCAADGRVVEGLRRAGLSSRVAPMPQALAHFGGRLAHAGTARRSWALVAGALPYALRLRRALRRTRPDLLHCNQARGVLLAGPAARSLGLPVLWHQRGLPDLPPLALTACRRLTRGVVCVSRAVDEALGSGGPPRWVVENAIDPAEAPRPAEVDAAQAEIAAHAAGRGLERPTVLVSASSFLPYKGLHHLVSALGELVRRRLERRRRLLWLVLGDAEDDPARRRYRRHLEERLADLGLADNVQWLGWRDHPLPFVAAADLAVLPTVARERFRYPDGTVVEAVCSEGFPRTVLEAMLVETTVVASDVAGVSEQLGGDGDTAGRRVPPGDPIALADALEPLIDRPAERRRLAAAARRRVELFSPAVMADKMLPIYRRLAGFGAPTDISRQEP